MVHMHQCSMVHMHRTSQNQEAAYAPAKIQGVPNKPKTPNRVIRVDDELWADYGRACEAEGTIRSEDLRAHMLKKVRAWKRRMRGAEPQEPGGADEGSPESG